MPPQQQPTMPFVAGLVGPEEFAGSIALVVGGSRGSRRVDRKSNRDRWWTRNPYLAFR